MSSKTKPDKKEIAQMHVLSVMGHSANSIGRRLGRSPHTVRKYRNSEVDLRDPVVQQLMNLLVKTELDDLRLLGGKGRDQLHKKLDEGKMRPIELLATIDRCFQQRRLLEGQSTENISFRDMGRKLMEDVKRLKADIADDPPEDSSS